MAVAIRAALCVWLLVRLVETAAASLADDWYTTTRCQETSDTHACTQYERCKTTHRCARGDEDYFVRAARHKSYTREFAGGNRSRIALMNDFEDWKSGTHQWNFQSRTFFRLACYEQPINAHSAGNSSASLSTTLLGWSTFDFTVIGSLELADGYIVFDTDRATISGDVTLQGVLTATSQRTEVAVFNFMTVYLGSNVRVRLQGSRGLSILSRSSMIIDTLLQVRPGTLGGFPGGGFIGSGATNNNRNGPGSTNTRVYVKTLSTIATHVPEIQEIETSAAPGQKLQGHFVIYYKDWQTQPIPYDAHSYEVQKYLETAFHDVGSLHVERDDMLEQVPEIGRLWRVTFATAVGNVPQLRAQSLLTGLASQVVTRTVRDGNQLSGSFQLSYNSVTTRPLPHNISAQDLREALLEDISVLIDAHVSRSDALGQCLQGSTLPDETASMATTASTTEDSYQSSQWLQPNQRLVDDLDSVKAYPDKLCSAGRSATDGYVWKLQFWTRLGNQMPLSPTSPVSQLTDAAAPLTVDGSLLQGTGASAQIVDSQYFSLAFGGAGASFASPGGSGYDQPYRETIDYAQVYSDEQVSDLLGGSGGAGGGIQPMDVFPVVQPVLGGAGAGAIFLSAVNDLLIGVNGNISAGGGRGSNGYTAGGGGSGGTILLISGGTIAHHGTVEAMGGHGGSSQSCYPGGGGSGGRIAMYAQAYSSWGSGLIQLSGGASQDSDRVGSKGSSYIRVLTNLAMRVDPTLGAAGTFKSLLVDGSETYEVGSQASLHPRSQQVVRNGPRYVLSSAQSRPTRVSYFVRVGNFATGRITTNRGAIFGLHQEAGDANASEAAMRNSSSNKNAYLIAIAIINGEFAHEANGFHWPRQVFQRKIQPNRWYKLDIFLDWDQRVYSIQLNDVLKVLNAPFLGAVVRSVSLSNFHTMSTWWDEIYIGDNHLMQFGCPRLKQRKPVGASTDGTAIGALVIAKRPLRHLWAISNQAPATSYHPKTLHTSHLSAQDVYKYDNGGIVSLDGDPHRAFFNDIREQETESPDGFEQENFDSVDEIISQAELLTMWNLSLDSAIVQPLETGVDFATLAADETASRRSFALPSSSETMSTYWYSEVFNSSTNLGGIGACSTTDNIEWRNEGIMLHFVNLTDPFGIALKSLLADRPKVMYNSKTKQFVMWIHVDNANNSMGLSGVAVSDYPNGPFAFKRSFYPDAPLEAPGGQSINETHDQTIALLDAGIADGVVAPAYLIRTYFKTVELWLPRPVMDPLWQSVQNADGRTEYGLSYHRAFYHEGYDNPNDIYLQRWRMEDKPWEVICCEPTNTTNCVSYAAIPETETSICPEGMEKTQLLGQSQTTSTPPIVSRYKDPNDDRNSFFVPNSVPSHASWGFQVYNIKTWRGNYFDALSTNISLFTFQRFAGERRRLEIEIDPSIPFVYPNEETLTQYVIPTNDMEIVDALLSTLGVPISEDFKNTFSSYDLEDIDINSDGKITSSEIAALMAKEKDGELTSSLVNSLMAAFNTMKWDQVAVLDADNDGLITFKEFENWVGIDPNLLFDQFDMDKNGYLDENELARSLWYRQMPRLDTAIILLDPSFDGRVYYHRFFQLVLSVPDFIFKTYDVDDSETLSQFEIGLMITDLGPAFADTSILQSLVNTSTNSISKAAYTNWITASTSLLGDARNSLKIDNAVHGTRPDSLTGPLYVVEQRRAKYVAISKLASDYLSTEGLLKEIEGDFEGREALLNFFAFAEDLFGLQDDDIQLSVAPDDIVPFRSLLTSAALGDRASFWNGRHWEGRPSAPSLFTYGTQCLQVAGVSSGNESGCLPCATKSPYVTSSIDMYQSELRYPSQCQPQKELDAYIKGFDQQVAIQLQYQQRSLFGAQGLQPHLSPCWNQSQFFPCDVHKVSDGNIADTLRNASARTTQWNLAWESHQNNVGSSTKIRADDWQDRSLGPAYIERFPSRLREPIDVVLDANATYEYDQWANITGGGT